MKARNAWRQFPKRKVEIQARLRHCALSALGSCGVVDPGAARLASLRRLPLAFTFRAFSAWVMWGGRIDCSR